jgi:2-polyprenyl-6-methoxyphenol hydroxylase-like FAD-dependent oxidoreductase
MKNTTVLISGAGIAGTALAYWLHRHGFRVTVVERATTIRDGGYKIDIRGAALEVVRRMGILDDIRALTTDVRTGSVVNAGGRRVASMDGDTFGGREHGDAEILRGDLNRMLFDLTKGDVEYLFDESITDLNDTTEGVEVTFASDEIRTFDLVVGADGLHSGTRARVFGDERRFLRDLGYRVSIFSVPNHLGLDREELTYVSPGHTVLMYSTARDTGAKAMFLFADDGSLPEDGRAHLADAYRTEGWEVPKLLESCAQAPDFYLDSLSQVYLDHWSRGRIALVGDAAYAASTASGQGTSLALVGAYVLAGELAAAGDGDGDHEAGFAAYEQQMRPFVEQNQKLGPANIKRMVLAGKAQVWLSMTFLSLLAKLPGKDRLLAKAIEPIHRAANAIDLADY